MKLALLGRSISHSLSPSLYRELLGDKLERYDLLDCATSAEIPDLKTLAESYDGLSITSPYKEHFFSEVIIQSPLVKELAAINTLSFRKSGIFGTNTDVIAVEQILTQWKEKYGELSLVLLGDGVMARLTRGVARNLGIPYRQFSRRKGDDLTQLDLSQSEDHQTIVINTCSRDFIFRGKLAPSQIFWDFNYSFLPHQSSIPVQVKTYVDGQEMLRLQALAAIDFWNAT